MSGRLSHNTRQRIVDEYVLKNGGWNAESFFVEVRDSGGEHPAWSWFTWDGEKAAFSYNVAEARHFVHGLIVLYEIELVEHGEVIVTYVEGPMVFSPPGNRNWGGGYCKIDVTSETSMGDFCDEASTALHSWIRRYHLAVVHAGRSIKGAESLAAALEAKAAAAKPKAA